MNDSILESIKKLLGYPEDYEQFDADLITHINFAIATLHQIGLGDDDFMIQDSSSVWSDFISETYSKLFPFAKEYVHLRCESLFEPSTSSSVQSSHKEMLDEALHRIMWLKDDIDEV